MSRDINEILSKLNSLEEQDALSGLRELEKNAKDGNAEIISEFIRLSPKCVEILAIWDDLSYRRRINSRLGLAMLSTVSSLLNFCSKDGDLGWRLVLARDIVSHRLDSIFDLLQDTKQKPVGTALNILAELVSTGDDMARDLYSRFNWQPKLLGRLSGGLHRGNSNTDGAARRGFVRFALSFLRCGDPSLLKNVLLTKSFVTGVMKGLHGDCEEIARETISTISTQVVKNSLVSRRSLINFFSWRTMENLIKTFDGDFGPTVREELGHLLYSVCCDPTRGLAEPCPNWSLSSPGHIYKHNTVLFNTILLLKPFEDKIQYKIVEEVLTICPELSLPFLQAASLSLEPKPSVRWFSDWALAMHCVGLPPGPFRSRDGKIPSSSLPVLESVIPSCFSRALLNRGLLHESLLVSLKTFQLISLVFDKFESISRESGEDGDKIVESSREGLRKRLPDIQTIMSVHHRILPNLEKATIDENPTEYGIIDESGDVSLSEAARMSIVGSIHSSLMETLSKCVLYLPEVFTDARFDVFKFLGPIDKLMDQPVEIQASSLALLASFGKSHIQGSSFETSMISVATSLLAESNDITIRHLARGLAKHVLSQYCNSPDSFLDMDRNGEYSESDVWIDSIHDAESAKSICLLVSDCSGKNSNQDSGLSTLSHAALSHMDSDFHVSSVMIDLAHCHTTPSVFGKIVKKGIERYTSLLSGEKDKFSSSDFKDLEEQLARATGEPLTTKYEELVSMFSHDILNRCMQKSFFFSLFNYPFPSMDLLNDLPFSFLLSSALVKGINEEKIHEILLKSMKNIPANRRVLAVIQILHTIVSLLNSQGSFPNLKSTIMFCFRLIGILCEKTTDCLFATVSFPLLNFWRESQLADSLDTCTWLVRFNRMLWEMALSKNDILCQEKIQESADYLANKLGTHESLSENLVLIVRESVALWPVCNKDSRLSLLKRVLSNASNGEMDQFVQICDILKNVIEMAGEINIGVDLFAKVSSFFVSEVHDSIDRLVYAWISSFNNDIIDACNEELVKSCFETPTQTRMDMIRVLTRSSPVHRGIINKIAETSVHKKSSVQLIRYSIEACFGEEAPENVLRAARYVLDDKNDEFWDIDHITTAYWAISKSFKLKPKKTKRVIQFISLVLKKLAEGKIVDSDDVHGRIRTCLDSYPLLFDEQPLKRRKGKGGHSDPLKSGASMYLKNCSLTESNSNTISTIIRMAYPSLDSYYSLRNLMKKFIDSSVLHFSVIYAMLEIQSSLVTPELLVKMLSVYTASVSCTDKDILKCIRIAESAGSGPGLADYAWGDVAVSQFELNQNYVLPDKISSSLFDTLLTTPRINATLHSFGSSKGNSDQILDLEYVLPLFDALITYSEMDPRKLVSCGILPISIMSTTLENEDERSIAYNILNKSLAKIQAARRPDLLPLELLLLGFRNSIEKGLERGIGIVTAFLARASQICIRPDHVLFQRLTKYLVQHSVISVDTISSFLKSWNGSGENLRKERLWILETLRIGMIDGDSFAFCHRNKLFAVFLGTLSNLTTDSGTTTSILHLVEQSFHSWDHAATTIMNEYGLCGVIHSLLVENRLSEAQIMVVCGLFSTAIAAVNQKRKWTRGPIGQILSVLYDSISERTVESAISILDTITIALEHGSPRPSEALQSASLLLLTPERALTLIRQSEKLGLPTLKVINVLTKCQLLQQSSDHADLQSTISWLIREMIAVNLPDSLSLQIMDWLQKTLASVESRMDVSDLRSYGRSIEGEWKNIEISKVMKIQEQITSILDSVNC